MNLPPAEEWLFQAESDRTAASLLMGTGDLLMHCQAVAKCQQSVEKAVKALASELGITVGYRHELDNLVQTMKRHVSGRRNLAGRAGIAAVLTRHEADIRALGALAPSRPAPGNLHRRNTEYPFEQAAGDWIAPARPGVFSSSDVHRFWRLANEVTLTVTRVVATIKRNPKRGTP